MKVDGSCHCGRIRYEAEVDPGKVVICHCTDCQTLSGTVFRTVVPTKEGTFRLLSGTPKVYVKTGESGNKREQTFCADCGTPIYSGPGGPDAPVLSLRVGALRQRDSLIPPTSIGSARRSPGFTASRSSAGRRLSRCSMRKAGSDGKHRGDRTRCILLGYLPSLSCCRRRAPARRRSP